VTGIAGIRHVRKHAGILVASLVLAMALGYMVRDRLVDMVDAQLTRDMFVAGDYDDFDPGPAVGSHFPGLQASHEGKTVTLLSPFAGANGTVLFINRSLDTCRYSRRQMIQLQQLKAGFDAAGIGMAVLTADSPDIQQAFARDHRITIPALSDIHALSARTLGLVDAAFKPGDARYGDLYPGMLVVDRDGIVVGKLFLADLRTRVDSAAALTYARTALGVAP